jgi:DNA-binding response OmpR family regulator
MPRGTAWLGSTFWNGKVGFFPISQRPDRDKVMTDARRCRVLFVEDEALISLMVEDMLLDFGIEIVGPAATLENALELARDADIDAAVLDINVGGVFTYPVADVVQARGLPVIFSTGYQATVLPERFRGAQVLHKPFDAKSLHDVLEVALAESPCEMSAA